MRARGHAVARAAAAWITLIFPGVAAGGGPEVREVQASPWVDGAIAASTIGAVLTTELGAKDALAPATCRWCAPPGLDVSVRRALARRDTTPALAMSNVMAFVIVPLSTIGLDLVAASDEGVLRQTWWNDVLLILEAEGVSLALNQVAKYGLARERPFVHARDAEGKARLATNDDNLSFYSGHTAGSFTLATAAGTIASMRGYRAAPLVWFAGLATASAAGYLRIAGDKHWFTDVAAGALVGGGVGFAIPWLFHRTRGTVTVGGAQVDGARVVAVRGVF